MNLLPETISAADVIRLLELEPLPQEGGWFRRTGESLPAQANSTSAIPASADRAWSSILALFTPDGFSALHRLTKDEIWCFHAGDPLDALRLNPDGRGERVTLGLDAGAGQRLHDVVRAGIWQGARVRYGGRWALVSCVVVPGFTRADFELGAREELARVYPSWRTEIVALTRE